MIPSPVPVHVMFAWAHPPMHGDGCFMACADPSAPGQSLISTAGSGEDELMSMMVADETPESRLQTLTAIGGFITVVAVVMSTLCGKDPWGETHGCGDPFGGCAGIRVEVFQGPMG